MARAWSIGKTERCKCKIYDDKNNKLKFSRISEQMPLTFLFLLSVKMTSEIKKNIEMQNVSPASYLINNSTRNSEPTWR